MMRESKIRSDVEVVLVRVMGEGKAMKMRLEDGG